MSWVGATSGTTNDAAHNYNNLANWSGGVIDDSFAGTSFTASTTLYLSSDRTTGAAGLNLGYGGDVDLTIMSSSGTARTLTLGGEISGNFGGTSNRTVTLGNATAKVNLDLGGTTRTINPQGQDTLNVVGAVSSGGLIKIGSGVLFLGGTNTFSGGLLVKSGTVSAGGNSSLGGNGAGAVLLGDTSHQAVPAQRCKLGVRVPTSRTPSPCRQVTLARRRLPAVCPRRRSSAAT